jgi:S-(hydroxymethyl)glutathione dehydrogenase/alcohol dehydrogenase
MQGKIQIDPMITHTLTPEQFNEGFELLRSGRSIRSVIVF